MILWLSQNLNDKQLAEMRTRVPKFIEKAFGSKIIENHYNKGQQWRDQNYEIEDMTPKQIAAIRPFV